MVGRETLDRRGRCGRALRAHRERLLLTQPQLADEIGKGITQRQISNFELGRIAERDEGAFSILLDQLEIWDDEHGPTENREEERNYKKADTSFARTADSLENLVAYLRSPEASAKEKEIVLHNVLSLTLDIMESIRDALSLNEVEK